MRVSMKNVESIFLASAVAVAVQLVAVVRMMMRVVLVTIMLNGAHKMGGCAFQREQPVPGMPPGSF